MQGYLFLELNQNVDSLKVILDEEEGSFSRTFDAGERFFEKCATEAKRKSPGAELKEEDAWQLWDTYGFPIDLTRLMAKDVGLRVGEQEFEKVLEAKFGEFANNAYMYLCLNLGHQSFRLVGMASSSCLGCTVT